MIRRRYGKPKFRISNKEIIEKMMERGLSREDAIKALPSWGRTNKRQTARIRRRQGIRVPPRKR